MEYRKPPAALPAAFCIWCACHCYPISHHAATLPAAWNYLDGQEAGHTRAYVLSASAHLYDLDMIAAGVVKDGDLHRTHFCRLYAEGDTEA